MYAVYRKLFASDYIKLDSSRLRCSMWVNESVQLPNIFKKLPIYIIQYIIDVMHYQGYIIRFPLIWVEGSKIVFPPPTME